MTKKKVMSLTNEEKLEASRKRRKQEKIEWLEANIRMKRALYAAGGMARGDHAYREWDADDYYALEDHRPAFEGKGDIQLQYGMDGELADIYDMTMRHHLLDGDEDILPDLKTDLCGYNPDDYQGGDDDHDMGDLI